MRDTPPACGLWSLAVIDSAPFILSAFHFFKPQSGRRGSVRRGVEPLCAGDAGLSTQMVQRRGDWTGAFPGNAGAMTLRADQCAGRGSAQSTAESGGPK